MGSNTSPFTLGTNLAASRRNSQLLQALLKGVRRQLVQDVDRLTRAVTAGDCPAAARSAQSLQGLADAVSASALHALATKLQTHAQSGSLDAVDLQLNDLRAEAERCIAYIPVVMKRIDGPAQRQ